MIRSNACIILLWELCAADSYLGAYVCTIHCLSISCMFVMSDPNHKLLPLQAVISLQYSHSMCINHPSTLSTTHSTTYMTHYKSTSIARLLHEWFPITIIPMLECFCLPAIHVLYSGKFERSNFAIVEPRVQLHEFENMF